MKRPRIAITHDSSYNIDAYVRAVALGGGEPVTVTPGHPIDLASVDGLLLSGGVDVDPEVYGQLRHPKTETPKPKRDELERGLLREALRRDVPVLAICRGLQLFNVEQGGTLHQHLPDVLQDGAAHEDRRKDKSLPSHSVEVTSGSRLAAALGATKALVNSRHHQAIDRVGEGLTISAVAEDGTIEGIERPDRRFAVAVQWHPEDQAGTDPSQLRIFQKFIECARAREY